MKLTALLAALALALSTLVAHAQEPIDIATGTATITAPGTSIAVPHGLGEIPVSVLVTPTNDNGAVFWVSTIDATNFTINIPVAQASDATFMWLAYVEGGEDVFLLSDDMATIGAGNTTAVVTHDLGDTPDFVAIQPEGDGSQVLWISNNNGTSFTLNLPAGQGSDVSFRWFAIKKEAEPTNTGVAQINGTAIIPQPATTETVPHGGHLPPRAVFALPMDEDGSVYRINRVDETDFDMEIPAPQVADADYEWTIFSQWPLFAPEPSGGIQPIAAPIPSVQQHDSPEQQRQLPLMGIIGQAGDEAGMPLVRLTLTILAGAVLLLGAWGGSRLSPDNNVPALIIIIILDLVFWRIGVYGWGIMLALAIFSTGIISYSQRTP